MPSLTQDGFAIPVHFKFFRVYRCALSEQEVINYLSDHFAHKMTSFMLQFSYHESYKISDQKRGNKGFFKNGKKTGKKAFVQIGWNCAAQLIPHSLNVRLSISFYIL